MAKKKSAQAQLAEQIDALQRSIEQWHFILENGVGDPFWSDGANINLTRNHIIGGMDNIRSLCEENALPIPDICNTEIPPEMPYDFYAKRDIIILEANRLIKEVEQKYDMTSYKSDSKFVSSFEGFKRQLEQNDLAYVRRYDFKRFADEEAKEEKRLHNFAETQQGQLGLFNVTPTSEKKAKIVDNKVDKEVDNEVDNEIDQTKELMALYNECLVGVKSNWSKMLDTAAKTYRQNFINQAMIYGQSENITLVAAQKDWNKANRYLNFNAKYIKAIARHGEKLIENRLYDISETYGDDIVLNKAPDEHEITALNQALNDKYKCNAQRLTDVIKTIVAGIYVTSPVEEELKPYERTIKNSVYYITCKRLDLLKIGVTMKFADIEKIDNDIITKIGKSISSTSQKLIKEIENELKNIRSVENGRNIFNQRSGIRGARELDFARQENRDLLQTRIERNRNTDFRAVNQPFPSGGQLSFGALRQSDNGIYGGNEQRPIGHADVTGQADEDAASAGGRAERDGTHSVQSINGEKSTAENGQYFGSGTALEHTENASDRDSKRGNLSRNLTYSPKEKFADNINAIKVMKSIKHEKEIRFATDEEKNILSKYVGWGGLSSVFDENKTAWENEYSQLKDLLFPAEYEAARASTLTAYYTDPLIVSAMYQGLANMNITDTAKVLEPSCGIGKFFSAIPKSFQNAELHGVELDPISGEIAQAL